MLPIRDDNPTFHRAFVTIALIVINLGVFAFVQARPGPAVVVLPDGREAGIDAEVKFTLQHAAIPCELTQARPLELDEVQSLVRGSSTTCDASDGDPLFGGKAVWLSALNSLFLHGGWFHVVLNMWFLWIFGNNIEDHLGPVKYAAFYVLCGLLALSAHVVLQPDSSVPVVGASGAVAGVMGAYLIWFPSAPIRTLALVFVLRIRAIWWLSIWFVMQFFTGQDSGIAWAAHVGGFVVGAAIAIAVRQIRPLCRWAWREPYRRRAFDRWDLSGGTGASEPPRFGRRTW